MNPDVCLEREANGEVIVMPPSGGRDSGVEIASSGPALELE